MKEIKLTQGLSTMVDDEDYYELNKFKWYARKSGSTFYAVRNYCENGKNKKIHMHRQIISNNSKNHTDHIDNNGLNNQRYNLRICTNQQNQANRRTRIHTSIYKGVYWDKNANKWKSQIKVDNMPLYLGLFKDEKEAGMVYNTNAIKYFGEFARLNVIKEEVK